MSWVAAFFFWIVATLLGNALFHRYKAKKQGDTLGSTWWHLKQFLKETKEERAAQKRASEESQAGLRYSLQSSTPSDQHHRVALSPKQKKREQKKRDRNALHDTAGTSSQGTPPARPLTTPSVGVIDVIRFDYNDLSGRGTTRTVAVSAIDNIYFEGFCHLRNEKRTFHISKVRSEVVSLNTGEITSMRTWARQARRHSKNRTISFEKSDQTPDRTTTRSWQKAVYFTGFRSSRQGELEEMAEAAGWQARGGFSRSLTTMVAGPHTGTRQREQAQEIGIEVLTEEEFMARI